MQYLHLDNNIVWVATAVPYLSSAPVKLVAYTKWTTMRSTATLCTTQCRIVQHTVPLPYGVLCWVPREPWPGASSNVSHTVPSIARCMALVWYCMYGTSVVLHVMHTHVPVTAHQTCLDCWEQHRLAKAIWAGNARMLNHDNAIAM